MSELKSTIRDNPTLTELHTQKRRYDYADRLCMEQRKRDMIGSRKKMFVNSLTKNTIVAQSNIEFEIILSMIYVNFV